MSKQQHTPSIEECKAARRRMRQHFGLNVQHSIDINFEHTNATYEEVPESYFQAATPKAYILIAGNKLSAKAASVDQAFFHLEKLVELTQFTVIGKSSNELNPLEQAIKSYPYNNIIAEITQAKQNDVGLETDHVIVTGVRAFNPPAAL